MKNNTVNARYIKLWKKIYTKKKNDQHKATEVKLDCVWEHVLTVTQHFQYYYSNAFTVDKVQNWKVLD